MSEEINLLKDKVESDFIDMVQEDLETYVTTKQDAEKYLKERIEKSGANDFRIGAVLSKIQSNGWWKEGFQSFRDYIEAEFGISYRKAMYLIEIYNKLVEAEIPWVDIKGVGWSKLKELAKIIDKENYSKWVEAAEKMTVLDLRHAIKASLSGGDALPTTEVGEKNVSTFTAQVHEDQKEVITAALDAAKDKLGTGSTAVALDAICMNFMEGVTASPPKKDDVTLVANIVIDDGAVVDYVESLPAAALSDVVVEKVMRHVGYYKIFELFDSIWPDVEIQVALPTD